MSRIGTDGNGSRLYELRRWIAAADRGWKATLLGVGIVLALALVL